MTLQSIPLNRLIPSPANVRKTGAADGIEELAASIAAHGLLQNLTVRPGKGNRFEVVAGGRRLKALKRLAKDGLIAKDAPIPCDAREDVGAGEISLAENIVRLAMHPADQFTAFKAMADEDKGAEEIAGRFGCTASVVRQRLKLAAVSPRLMEAYRAGDMNLDQLMAFTVSDDHAAQEAVWVNQPSHSPHAIRRALTVEQVEADDPLAVYVGIDAYVAAGGHLNRDLFQPEHEGYLTDPALLDRLAREKLHIEADILRAEGWAWVEVMTHCDYATLRPFGRISPTELPLSDEQSAERDRLTSLYDALIAEHGDDPEPEIVQQLDDLSESIDALSSGIEVWADADKAMSGVIVSVDRDGSLVLERGLVRPEDRTDAPSPAPQDGEGAEGLCPAPRNADSLSDRLTEDLTAHRTAVLRVMLADRPDLALVAITHALALPLFYERAFGTGSSLDLRMHSVDLASSADDLADSLAGKGMDDRHAGWQSRMPDTADGLWDWLWAQPADVVARLLAFCTASSVNAVRKAHDRTDAPRLAHADRLAATLGLDMAQWWTPTASGFFGRMAKSRILAAVAEACSQGAADNLAKLKKDALAKRAEERLAGTGWLPAPLRSPVQDSAADEVAEAA